MKAILATLTLMTLAAAPVVAGGYSSVRVERTVEYPAPRLSVEPVRRPNVINVNLGINKPTYEYGESVCITLSVDQDAYVYLFSEEACGTVRQIFPNCFDSGNFLQACRTYRLPDGSYEFVVRGGAGTETLRAVASSVPLDCLDKQFRRSSVSDPFPTSYYSYTEISTQVSQSFELFLSDYNNSISFSSSSGPAYSTTHYIAVEPVRPCPAYGEASVSFCVLPQRVVCPPAPCPPVFRPTHYVSTYTYETYHRPAPVYYESTSININIGGGGRGHYNPRPNHFGEGRHSSGHHDGYSNSDRRAAREYSRHGSGHETYSRNPVRDDH